MTGTLSSGDFVLDAIKNFNRQFGFVPKIENSGDKKYKKFVVVGMGGSHLATDLLKVWNPALDVVIHQDYGLPQLSDIGERLIILSSYSGNTEEVLDALEKAGRKDVFVIASGGLLLEEAIKSSLPYIQLPGGLQPRSALGYTFRALLKTMGEEKALEETAELEKSLNPAEFEEQGKELAEKLRGYVPVIYSSAHNAPIAYNWKIKFNENSKIPAFFNVLPELNHNEMNGFDATQETKHLSGKFFFIFLKDGEDNPKVQKRMEVLKKLYEERGFRVEVVELSGRIFQKIFSSLLLADWASYYTALNYGSDPEKVPMVEEFKRLIK